MKKHMLLFALSQLLVTSIIAQNYGEIGTEWHYNGNGSGLNKWRGYQKVSSIKDTFFQGKQVKKIQLINFEQLTSNKFYPYYFYEYQSGDTIFQFNPQTFKYEVKFIFNLTQGDTVSFFYSDGYSGDDLKVDTVFPIQIGSLSLKQYELSFISSGSIRNLTLIDRIGFYDFFNLNSGGGPGSIFYANLRCYSDSLIDTNYNSFPCDFIAYTDINEQLLNSKISVYPNPALDKFTLVHEEVTIDNVKLFDMAGKEITISKISKNKFDISHIKSGIYMLKIETNLGITSKKLIKK